MSGRIHRGWTSKPDHRAAARARSHEVHRLVPASSRARRRCPVGSATHRGRPPRGPAAEGGPSRVGQGRPCRVGKEDLLGAVCCPDSLLHRAAASSTRPSPRPVSGSGRESPVEGGASACVRLVGAPIAATSEARRWVGRSKTFGVPGLAMRTRQRAWLPAMTARTPPARFG